MTVVAVARHIDEDRDEAVEAVPPRQHAHPRPLVELQDVEREAVERVFVDLKQLVARIGFQHVDQRLAGMARRFETGAADDVVDLAAQVGNGAGRARIGGGREQAAEAALADQLAIGIEAFDADIVEVHAPVHARAHRRLGDNKHPRLFEELADLRRHGDKLGAAAQQPHLGRAQQSEAGLEHRLQTAIVIGVGIIARAEQGEIVAGEPFQKLDSLGDIGGRQRRWVLPQIGDDIADARQHRRPVGNGHADLGEDCFESRNEVFARRGFQRSVDVNVDEALAPAGAVAPRYQADEVAARIALDRENRMHQKRNAKPALMQLAGH